MKKEVDHVNASYGTLYQNGAKTKKENGKIQALMENHQCLKTYL